MLPDRVSNPGPLTYKSGALPIALRGPALDLVSKELKGLALVSKQMISLAIASKQLKICILFVDL